MSHDCKLYRNITLTFEDNATLDNVKNRLAYLQEEQCKQVYDFVEKIGAGKFSVVYKAYKKDQMHKSDKIAYAIKVIDKKILKEDE